MAKAKRLAKKLDKPALVTSEALETLPVFTREQVVRGGTNGAVVCRKLVVMPDGERGIICHLPVTAQSAIDRGRISKDDKEALGDYSMKLVAGHLCDEDGKLLFKDATDAGAIHLDVIIIYGTALMGGAAEDPTVTDQ